MKKYIIYLAIIIFIISCKAPTKKVAKPIPKKLNKLEMFFQMCKTDLTNGANIVIDNDIVKNLSHLLNMGGGKKYYILERESITKMIRSVTKGVYDDFIIINKAGTIIYTMNNNDIFDKNVRRNLGSSPYNRCYDNRKMKLYIDDVSWQENDYYLYVSMKVSGKNSFPGIFILKANINKLRNYIKDEKIEIIGKDKLYRVSDTSSETLKLHKDSATIDIDNFQKSKPNYKQFRFNNLNWLVIKKK